MKIHQLSKLVSVSDQLALEDIQSLVNLKIETVVCNRPDNEQAGQPKFEEVSAALSRHGIAAKHLPFVGSNMTRDDIAIFSELLCSGQRIHAYCRSGTRSRNLFEASIKEIEGKNKAADFKAVHTNNGARFDVLIIGGGSAGIATASSLLKRKPDLRIAVIEPSDEHFYQPGWTMVGGGVFDAAKTKRRTCDLVPVNCEWIRQTAKAIQVEQNSVTLEDDSTVHYSQLVIATGLVLNWAGIEGLEKSLGANGVTSNYRYDLAPYTWKLVQGLKKGRALFTQPPMPIKCAGAPQKAMYLSGSHWFSSGLIGDIEIEFYNAAGVLFGVEAYVPALMKYVEKYQAKLNFQCNLLKVDGASQTAWFQMPDGEEVERQFDLLHVVPPQCAPALIKDSGLADEAGWLDVDQFTLQHKRQKNIWGVGDVINAPSAKTMAAARKQAPVVAHNIIAKMATDTASVFYDGYGSCPLTVEQGKIVLAEFGYEGKLLPSFPSWLNKGTEPSKFAWVLKKDLLPSVYWQGMLKGREWLATPKKSQR